MHSMSIIDQLDRNIDALLAGAHVTEHGDPLLTELTDLSRDLRLMSSEGFQQRLLADLNSRAFHLVSAAGLSEAQRLHVMGRKPAQSEVISREIILPTLFAEGTGLFRAKRSSYALSVAAHAVVLTLLLTSGMWMTRHSTMQTLSRLSTDVELSEYVPPVSTTQAHGGGGGGDHEKLDASKGELPKASMQQITPPMIVPNEDPKLSAEPTVVLSPNQVLPQLGPLGDPMSHLGNVLSNGTGMNGGMGNGTGGGIGSGTGVGIGAGRGGGYGGGVFKVGGGVSAPRATYDPDPDYSEEARKAKHQGVVQLWMIVDPSGHPKNIRVSRSLGMGLDEKAVEAVSKWRFEPAMKDGHPVPVEINVEVNFHLY